VSYSSSSSLLPNFFAIAAVTLGCCPVPSCRHCYCRVDCWIVCAADAASLSSFYSLLSLRPHFCAHSPDPSCQLLSLRRLPLWQPLPSGNAGDRVLEGVPTTVLVGHAATEDGDCHSLLRHSLCMMLQYTGYNLGASDCWPENKTGLWHKTAQKGTNWH
jgi:hypothetical protein